MAVKSTTKYKAKRAGWNEVIPPALSLDRDPIDYPSTDIEGELEKFNVPTTEATPALTVYLVGGQEADPATIRQLTTDNVFCPTGPGGGVDPTCGRTNSYRSFNSIPADERVAITRALADYTETDYNDVRKLLKKDTTPLPVREVSVGRLHEQLQGVHTPDESKVSEYQSLLTNPSFEMDPVYVRGDRFFDGGHRVYAYKRAGRTGIPAIDIEPLWVKYAYGPHQPTSPQE